MIISALPVLTQHDLAMHLVLGILREHDMWHECFGCMEVALAGHMKRKDAVTKEHLLVVFVL